MCKCPCIITISYLLYFYKYCQKCIFTVFFLHLIYYLINLHEIWYTSPYLWYACLYIHWSPYFICFWRYCQKYIFGANLGALFGELTAPRQKHQLIWNLTYKYNIESRDSMYFFKFIFAIFLGTLPKIHRTLIR